MTERFNIDAHTHVGTVGDFFTPQNSGKALLAMMERLGIQFAVCTDLASAMEGAHTGLECLYSLYKESKGRIKFLGVYHPGHKAECLAVFKEALKCPGFRGLKLHPSAHGIPADSDEYAPAWKFAADHDLAILTHSWSVSGHNPVQKLSIPERFEKFAKGFPGVRFVLGHAGGRGSGRGEALRMAKKYRNVHLDFAGDIFCCRLIESLVAAVPPEKILFGSDFPWLSPNANFSRVLLADIPNTVKQAILGDNAARVYKIKANQE